MSYDPEVKEEIDKLKEQVRTLQARERELIKELKFVVVRLASYFNPDDRDNGGDDRQIRMYLKDSESRLERM